MVDQDCRPPRVTVESKLTAISSRPVTHGTTHTLSALDHAMGLHSLHLIFYYRESPFGFVFDFDPAWISLSDALSLYHPVTGRLNRVGSGKKWEVKCNDAGVRTLRAKVGGNTTVSQWLKTAGAGDERELVGWEDLPEDPSIWSPFQIQLNDFDDGGIAIGLSCSHLLADLTSAAMLIKTWTDIYRHKPIEDPPIFRNPTRPVNHHDPSASNMSRNYYETKTHETQPASVNMVTATFNFSNIVIKECILEKTQPGCAPFDFLCSLFWTRLAQLHPDKTDPPSNHSISICMDFRKLLSLPLEQFGNFLHFFPVSIPTEEFSRGSGHVAGIVHDHIEKLGQDQFWTGSECLESLVNHGERLPMYGPELTFVNMEHVPIYDAVFVGDQRPVHVSCHVGRVCGEGLVMVLPSSESGSFGRTVMVVLPEEDMVRVLEDPEMVRLNPRILLEGDPMYM